MTLGIETPIGPMMIEGADRITRLRFAKADVVEQGGPVLDAAAQQIAEYFAGTREVFDMPLALGDGFKRDFLQALLAIPYGVTCTYGDLARDLDVSAQAIGQACGANTIPLIIPCHRVLAADGLGGYSGEGGIETKVALLKHERAASLLI